MSFTTANTKKDQGIDNLKKAGRNFAEAGESAVQEANESLSQKAEHAGQEVRRYINDASDRVQRASSDLEHAINEKPIQSTLVALCAGVVLGMLLKR